MKDFTIVIATAIRPTLEDTLISIENSVLLPNEVIISIPSGRELFINKAFNFKIKIISKGEGQVAQRKEGFKRVKTTFCIQMDDDIIFDKYFLKLFVERFMKLPFYSVLAPMNSINNETLSVLVSPKPFFACLLYYILDSRLQTPYGIITKAGIPVGVKPFYDKSKESSIVKSQWINGCCAIHNTANLITNYEYPFKGKAYGEDIIQSQILREKKITLFVDRSLRISLKEDISKLNILCNLYIFFKEKNTAYRAISSFKKVQSNYIRYILFAFFFVISKIVNSLENLIKNLIKFKNN